jgi:tetratricopeptide (TPR) repeat protein
MLILVMIILLYSLFVPEYTFLLGVLTYGILSIGLKRLIAKHYRKGIVYMKNNKYDLAISVFNKSFEFFNDYKWIDRFRVIILMSSSRVSYRESSLLNIAFCYTKQRMVKSY